ncbi:MAG: peptide ABC transporter substrate-binding protein [Wenzhouxiangellaceae bacterium]
MLLWFRSVRDLSLRLVAVILAVAVWVAPAAASTLHRGLGPAPDSLDPHRAQGLAAFNLLRDLHEGLLTRDAHGNPVPGVARSWQVSEDGRVWRFRLRDGARWSDGLPIVAGDFVRGWRRARDPATASPVAGWLEPVVAAEAPEDDLLIVRLVRRVPWFEELLTLPLTVPWPEAHAPRYSGAFMLQRRIAGARFELVRNPHFHAADRVELDGVVWHVTEDPGAELSRFRAGELHVTETVPPGRLDWLRRELGPAVRVSPYLGSFYLVFNLSRPPFDGDPRIRRALSLAIDRDILVERVLGSGELPAMRLVPPGLPGWPEYQRPESGDHRLRRARALLREAGHGLDNPLRVELRFNTSLTNRRLGAAIAAMWKQHLGVVTRLVNEEWKVFVTNRRQGRITQIVRGGWIADWADPGNFLGLFAGDSALNYAFLRDPEFDALLDRAEMLSGPARTDVLWRAEQRLLDRHAIIPLYFYVSRHLVVPELRGWEDNPMDIHLSRWLAL